MGWIVASAIGSECSPKDTYRHLKLLPLSLYLELHDFLFFLQIIYGKYDIDFADFLTMKPEGRLRKLKIFDLPSLHYKRSQENFGIELRNLSILSIPLYMSSTKKAS